MEKRVWIFGKVSIIKNFFHKNNQSVNIDETEVKTIVLRNKESYGKRGALNTLLDI